MTNKGFTLIALMVVVAIISILAAIAVPSFIRFQEDGKKANENIRNGVPIEQVKDEGVVKSMKYKLGEATKTTEETAKEYYEKVNNTDIPVLKGSEVPQSDNNTVEPVLNNFPKRYTQIQCGGDGFIKGCTILFRQGDNQYIIPMSCEATDTNTYTCEVR